MAESQIEYDTYENVTVIIQAYEEAAVRDGSRQGIVSAAQAPLDSMDMLVAVSARQLEANNTRAPGVGGQTVQGQGEQQSANAEFTAESEIDNPGDIVDPEEDFTADISVGGEVSAGTSLVELLGGPDSAAGQWLSECLGCEGRLGFNWQVKPINLLGALDDFLDDIEAALDMFSARLDPFGALEDLCNLLDTLSSFCLPDILVMIKSLNLLIKQYGSNVLSIRLDWTTLLGPLLKAVVQGLVGIVNGIEGAIQGPLDCARAALDAAAEVEQAGRNTGSLVGQLSQNIDSAFRADGEPAFGEMETSVTNTDFKWNEGSPGTGPTEDNPIGENPELPELDAARRDSNAEQRRGRPEDSAPGESPEALADGTFPSSFNIKSSATLGDALADPSFNNATWIQKLILPVQEVSNYVDDLAAELNQLLRSLQKLVGGGLGANLQSLGIILFLLDIISLLIMILRLLAQNRNVTDWCSFAENNPQVLEDAIAGVVDSQVRVEAGQEPTSLSLRRGPDIVGSIALCHNKATGQERALVEQWISELREKS